MADVPPIKVGMVAGKDLVYLVIAPDSKLWSTPSGKGNGELGVKPRTTDVFPSFGFDKVIPGHFMKTTEKVEVFFYVFLFQPIDGTLSVKRGGLGGVEPGSVIKRDTETVVFGWDQAQGTHKPHPLVISKFSEKP